MTVELVEIYEVQQISSQFIRIVEPVLFQELNNDQRRELINARQRLEAWQSARRGQDRYKGSMTWRRKDGIEYLVRSSYDPRTGLRRQKSLGPRSDKTEEIKTAFERDRREAKDRLANLDLVLERQTAINRAVGLGQVPLIAARILRALDIAGLLGHGIRVVGTNAIYGYSAAAGVLVDRALTTTEDLDLLFDARRIIRFAVSDQFPERSLIALLRRVDRSFERTQQRFRAVNRDGYIVDFIKPLPEPPWATKRQRINTEADDELEAAEIAGLAWLENAQPFEAIAIDEKGGPVRISAPDPRVFAIHKLWLSSRSDRDPAKRRRDEAQASLVAELVTKYLTHLPFEAQGLEMLPRDVFQNAARLFMPEAGAS